MKARQGVALNVRHTLVCNKKTNKWSAAKGAQLAVPVPPESVCYDAATKTLSIRVDRILDAGARRPGFRLHFLDPERVAAHRKIPIQKSGSLVRCP